MLEGFDLTGPPMKRVACGVAASRSIKHLSLRNCNVSDCDFVVLAKSLRGQTSLVVLEVSEGNLTDACALSVSHLVKAQCLRRDRERWLCTLRNGDSDPVALRGLLVLNLSGNQGITDEFAATLTKAFTYDHWINEINLSDTCVSTRGAECFLRLLGTNSSLRSIRLPKSLVGGSVRRSIDEALRARAAPARVVRQALSALPGTYLTTRHGATRNVEVASYDEDLAESKMEGGFVVADATSVSHPNGSVCTTKTPSTESIFFALPHPAAVHVALAHWTRAGCIDDKLRKRLATTIEPISAKDVLTYLAEGKLQELRVAVDRRRLLSRISDLQKRVASLTNVMSRLEGARWDLVGSGGGDVEAGAVEGDFAKPASEESTDGEKSEKLERREEVGLSDDRGDMCVDSERGDNTADEIRTATPSFGSFEDEGDVDVASSETALSSDDEDGDTSITASMLGVEETDAVSLLGE
eukprot:g2612.t1